MKSLHLLVTFRTTSDAIAAELHLEQKNIKGRLIPVPVSVSASCGFAWMADPKDKEQIAKSLDEAGIIPENTIEMLI